MDGRECISNTCAPAFKTRTVNAVKLHSGIHKLIIKGRAACLGRNLGRKIVILWKMTGGRKTVEDFLTNAWPQTGWHDLYPPSSSNLTIARFPFAKCSLWLSISKCGRRFLSADTNATFYIFLRPVQFRESWNFPFENDKSCFLQIVSYKFNYFPFNQNYYSIIECEKEFSAQCDNSIELICGCEQSYSLSKALKYTHAHYSLGRRSAGTNNIMFLFLRSAEKCLRRSIFRLVIARRAESKGEERAWCLIYNWSSGGQWIMNERHTLRSLIQTHMATSFVFFPTKPAARSRSHTPPRVE